VIAAERKSVCEEDLPLNLGGLRREIIPGFAGRSRRQHAGIIYASRFISVMRCNTKTQHGTYSKRGM
jgi:hypothetical protein